DSSTTKKPRSRDIWRSSAISGVPTERKGRRRRADRSGVASGSSATGTSCSSRPLAFLTRRQGIVVSSSLLNELLPCPDDPLPERRQKFADGLRFRTIVSGAFALVFFCIAELTYLPDLELSAVFTILGFLVAVNALYWFAAKRTAFPLRHFYIHWLIDLVMISWILYLLGGMDVPYGFLANVMIVVTSATFLSKRSSFVVASAATL